MKVVMHASISAKFKTLADSTLKYYGNGLIPEGDDEDPSQNVQKRLPGKCQTEKI